MDILPQSGGPGKVYQQSHCGPADLPSIAIQLGNHTGRENKQTKIVLQNLPWNSHLCQNHLCCHQQEAISEGKGGGGGGDNNNTQSQ